MTSLRSIGCVKWFNKKSGYGFITVYDGPLLGKDIFVHYSSIRVSNSQYKYLVQGEYVEFVAEKSTMENHEYQATDISGVKEGPLMCQTIYKNMEESQNRGNKSHRPQSLVVEHDGDTGDFTPVVKRARSKSYSSILKRTSE